MPNRTIRDIIAHQKVLSAAPDCTVREAAQRMAEAKVGAMLILDGGRLAGIFTERDLLNRVVAKKLDPASFMEFARAVITPMPTNANASTTTTATTAMMTFFFFAGSIG